MTEATKDSARIGLFTAISTVASYFISKYLPNVPQDVQGAFMVILIFFITTFITYVDSKIHHSKKTKAEGLVNLFGIKNF